MWIKTKSIATYVPNKMNKHDLPDKAILFVIPLYEFEEMRKTKTQYFGCVQKNISDMQ